MLCNRFMVKVAFQGERGAFSEDAVAKLFGKGIDFVPCMRLKEGFGPTVSETLWKAKPVVASAVRGIPLQVKNKFTGLLSHGVPGTAYALRLLLTNPEYARWLGENGREHIRYNFLISRHLRDYLLLFLSLDHPGDVIRL